MSLQPSITLMRRSHVSVMLVACSSAAPRWSETKSINRIDYWSNDKRFYFSNTASNMKWRFEVFFFLWRVMLEADFLIIVFLELSIRIYEIKKRETTIQRLLHWGDALAPFPGFMSRTEITSVTLLKNQMIISSNNNNSELNLSMDGIYFYCVRRNRCSYDAQRCSAAASGTYF